MGIQKEEDEEFKPAYDIDVVNYAMSMGWDHNTVRGDFPSHEAVVEHYQKTLGLNFEDACAAYRQLIAEEIEEFLTEKLGPRS